MKIVQLLPALNEGGVERGTVDISREFIRRGHESVVISSGGRLVSQIEKDGGVHIVLEVSSKNIFTAPYRIWKLYKLLKELRPDIIHARSRVPAWLAYLANKKLGIPFVTTVHGFNSVNFYSSVMTRGDRVICASKFLIEHIQKHYLTPDSIIDLIPRGIDLEYFNQDSLDTAWRNDFIEKYKLHSKNIIVQVARVTQWKDQATVIKAFLEVRKDNDTLKLLLVGSVDKTRQGYHQELLGLYEASKYADDIVFTGNQTHIKEIFSIARINISAASSKPETFGRANVEGLVMGVPLLSTNIGASLDYVIEGKTGFFFEPRDYKDLACLIQKSLEYKFAPNEISAFAKENFSLDKMVESTIKTYRTVLDNCH